MKIKVMDIIIIITAIFSSLTFILFDDNKYEKKLIVIYNGENINIPFKNGLVNLGDYVNANMVLEIKDGAIRVIESSCKDKICMDFNAISKCGETIVCMPNKIAIKISCDGYNNEN